MEKHLFQETFSFFDETLSSFVNRNKIDRNDILEIVVHAPTDSVAVYTLFYYAEKPYRKQKG